MCQPGRPGPHGDGHSGSPGFAAFHSAKSSGLRFALVDLDTRAGALEQVVERAVRERAVVGQRRDLEVHALAFDHVRVARGDELGDELLHLLDELGRVRHLVGAQHAEPVELRPSTRPRTAPASSGSVVPRFVGPADDLVLDVGDVAHVGDARRRATGGSGGSRRTRPRCGRDRRAERRRPSGRRRTSTRGPARAARTRPWRARRCRRSAASRRGYRRAPIGPIASSGRSAPLERAATAHTAMPSARPIAPMPSPRLGFTRTWMPSPIGSAAAPARPTRFAAIASTCGARRGSSAATTTSTLPTHQPVCAHPLRDVAQQRRSTTRRATARRRGEQRAEIGQPGRAEHRVGDRVGDHVGVGVPGEAAARRDRDSAEHERTVAAERVHVVAEADPVLHAVDVSFDQGRRELEVGGNGDLEVAGLARARSARCRPLPRRAPRRRSRRRRRRVRGAQRLGAERLRSLHDDEIVARHRLDHAVAARPASPCR